MLNWYKVSFVLALVIAAVFLNSWVSATLAIVSLSLYFIDKVFDRLYPERKPEPTATELAARQIEFEQEIRAELTRIASMNNIKNVVGLR